MRRIIKFALFGLVGFGIGGAIGGIISVDGPILFGFPIMGGIGGMSLGLALKSWKWAGFLALAGMVGISFGYVINGFIMLFFGQSLQIPAQSLFGVIFRSLPIAGAVTGSALGLPLKSWKAAGFLALTGAIAFLVAGQVQEVVPLGLITHHLLSRIVVMVIWGVVGGALLGATLGYLKKE